MYVNPQIGQAAGTAAPAPHLGTFRRNILAAVIGNKLFTDAEQLKTNDSVYQTECPYKLALWLKNVRRVAAEREHTQGLRLLAEGLERGQELLAQPTVAPAAPEPIASNGLLSDLKMAAWKLNISETQRERLFERILAPGLTRAAAAQLLAELECADPAPEPQQWATPSQCDEVHRLACLPCFTAGEKAHALRALVTLTQAGAVKTIGSLYAAAWRRGTLEMRPESGKYGATPKRPA